MKTIVIYNSQKGACYNLINKIMLDRCSRIPYTVEKEMGFLPSKIL